MAFLNRVVDGAIILKIEGKSYRAHRARRVGGDAPLRDDSVNLQKNAFCCLNPQCAAKGNVLDLWMAYRNLPVYEAALDLADTFHLDIMCEQRRGNP